MEPVTDAIWDSLSEPMRHPGSLCPHPLIDCDRRRGAILMEVTVRVHPFISFSFSLSLIEIYLSSAPVDAMCF